MPSTAANSHSHFRGSRTALEILKSDEVYPKAGNHGVRQDALFIAAGLIMPRNEYAQGLLQLGIERLQRFQLDRVLLPDGVWQENSYGYHCLIMNVFQMLAGDLRRAGLREAGVLHDALRRMLPYAEGLIRPDGYGPLIGDTTPRRHFGIMARAIDELNEAGDSSIKEIELKTFVRAKDTYYFPEWWISREPHIARARSRRVDDDLFRYVERQAEAQAVRRSFGDVRTRHD